MKLRNQAKAIESLDRAREALRIDRPAQALRHAVEARRLDPDQIATLLLIARIELSLQRPANAMTTLDATYHLDAFADHSFEIRLLRVQALSALHRHGEALALLDELIEAFPGDAHLHRLAAAASESLGQTERTIASLERIVAIDPTDTTAARTLAHLLATGDPQASIKLVQPELSHEPSAMQWQSAQWMKQAGRQRDAEEVYRDLLASRSEDAALCFEAAVHADQMGANDVAIERYRQALSLKQVDRAAAQSSLARAFMHAGRFAEAVWNWWQVTRLNQDHPEAWAGLIVSALCCERAHLVEQAQRRFEQHADEDERVFLLAEAWMEASAGEVIHRVTQPARAQVVTASPLTWILQQSVDVLSTQIVRKPGWADTLYHTAICEAALGETDAASEHVQAALDINPNYKAATTLAARLPKAA